MGTMGFLHQEEKQKGITNIIPLDFKHGFISGATGSGKTATVIRPLLKDRIEQGGSVVFYDYKGHEHRYIKEIAKNANRLEDVIEIAKPFGKYINVLDFIDSPMLERFLRSSNNSGDPYWANTATRWLNSIVSILYTIKKIDNWVAGYNKEIHECYIDRNKYSWVNEKVSFRVVREIVASPKHFDNFLIFLKKSEMYYETLFRNIVSLESKKGYELQQIYVFTASIYSSINNLNEVAKNLMDITIDVNSADASGNNGVLQVLYNSITGLADKDFINEDEIELLEEIEKGKIIIVDMNAIGADIHPLLFEGILQKLVRRVQKQNKVAVSIIVDEANRVLQKDSDIYNDVLREAQVELIIAFQNEDQMINKLGEKWEEYHKNFIHQYSISDTHHLTYNTKQIGTFQPYTINTKKLDTAEIEYDPQ